MKKTLYALYATLSQWQDGLIGEREAMGKVLQDLFTYVFESHYHGGKDGS